MTTVFISYSRKDADFVRRLHEALGEQDHQTWVDWEGIAPTAEWMKEIVAAIDEAAAFVFVMTPDSMASTVCLQELAHAAAQNKRLIPIVRRDVEASSTPDSLAKLNWIFFRERDDFPEALQALVTAIDTDQDWVKAHTRLLVRAREWDAKGREASLALRGKDLKAAEQWLMAGPTKEPRPTELQTLYILQSRSSATRRRYALLGSAAIGLIIVAVLGTTTWFERRNAARQRTVALAGRLTADAELMRDRTEEEPAEVGWRERSVLLATEAARLLESVGVRSLQTDIAMRRGLALLPRRVASFESSFGLGVDAMVLTADGRMVAASKSRLRVEQWSAGGETIARQDLAGGVSALALSPDGQFLATTELNDALGVIDIWDAATLKPLVHFPGDGDQVVAFALSPGATYLVASTQHLDRRANAWVPGSTRVWSVMAAGHPELARLPPATSVSFSLDGLWLAAIVDSVPTVWKVASTGGFDLQEVPLAATGSDAWNVNFSADGKHLVVSFQNDDVKAWSVGDWKVVREFKSEASPSAVGPDARYAAVPSGNYTVSILDTASGGEVARVHAADKIEAMAFRPNGQVLAVGGVAKSIELWQIDIGGSDVLRVAIDGHFHGATFSSDEATLTALVSAGDKLGARHWSLTGKRESSRQAIDAAGDVTAFSADGRFIALASGRAATVIRRDDGKAVGSVRLEGKATAMALSPEGASLAIATDGGAVLLWQGATSKPPLRFALRGAVARGHLAVGPSGTTLVAVASEGVSRSGETLFTHVWQPPAETETARFPVGTGRSGLTAKPCALSADARYLATNQGDGVMVRETPSGRVVATVNRAGDPGQGGACAFSADSRLLATSGSSVVRVWETATQVEVVRVEQAEHVHDLIFSPKGRYLATVGHDALARVWLLEPADLIDTACKRLTRNLSREEWRSYFGEKPYGATCRSVPIPSAAPSDLPQ